MRKERIALSVYTLVLIFVLSVSVFPSFPYVTNTQDSTPDVHADVSSDNLVRPIIRRVNRIDKDFDGIQDSLKTMISQMIADRSAVAPVVITLNNPVLNRDLDWFVMLGGRVTHVYQHVTYGFAGVIPAVNISRFASLEEGNLCVIERDVPVRYYMDVSVPLIRARPVVWDTYGYTGSPSQSIAIIDTGIDDSHLDVGPFGNLNFSRKMVGWYDATADGAAEPEDYCGHGTHCAAIAAGTGEANPLQGSGFATTTWAYTLRGLSGSSGYLDYGFDIMNPGVITLTCAWTSHNNVILQLRDKTGNTVLNQISGTKKPLVLTYNAIECGRYRPLVGIVSGSGSGYFSLRETYPYQGKNDSYNLFTGVAPSSKLVGVKVFDNTGSATTSSIYGGMDWVIANKHTYNITVASMSIGLENGGQDTTFDQKADTMVENGIVTCVSAGNDFPDYTIGSPATAAYVITVAATNDENGITVYSSNGDPDKNEYGLIKPDVAAPGGSINVGSQIISADSNDVDYAYSGQSDYTPNDYQQMMGTSMSTPHVAGLAALIIDAFSGWNWTKDEALKVKMLISMTAFEVQSGESSNVPQLNRGDKDNKEGYGRICADAAIEAATMTYSVGNLATDYFGSDPSDKKVWARQVSMWTDNEYKFHLSVPSGADYDLYLYNGTPDDYGQPVILAKSINVSVGAEEAIRYTPTVSGTYYIVVKWVSGNGSFNLESTTEHDVEVISVTPSVSEVYEGNIVNITVVVKNGGGVFETFNVTVYYEENAIKTQTVTDLAPSTMKNLTFSWNTTGVAPCANYTIRAEASVVSEELNTENNSLDDGKVHVRIPGDIDGDGDVDKFDLGEFATAYGTKKGDPKWNPLADFIGDPVSGNPYPLPDGDVDKYDLAIFAENYRRKS